jgi:integrase
VRLKLFPRRKDADVYLVKVRSLVANHTYLADSESITVAEAAKAGSTIARCAARPGGGWSGPRCAATATMCGCTSPRSEVGIGDKLIAQLTRRHVNEFRDRLLLNGGPSI